MGTEFNLGHMDVFFVEGRGCVHCKALGEWGSNLQKKAVLNRARAARQSAARWHGQWATHMQLGGWAAGMTD